MKNKIFKRYELSSVAAEEIMFGRLLLAQRSSNALQVYSVMAPQLNKKKLKRRVCDHVLDTN
jgi:hypothetical protein